MYPFLGKGEARLRLGSRGLRLGDHKDRPDAGHIQLQFALERVVSAVTRNWIPAFAERPPALRRRHARAGGYPGLFCAR
jgi:hypothetical protein